MNPALEGVEPAPFTPETSPLEVIGWAIQTYPDLTMPSAFNLNGVVLLDFAARAGYQGKVLFVDTGYHFPETLKTRDALAARYPQLEFKTLNAHLPDTAQYLEDVEGCCAAHKVGPLNDYLEQTGPSALLNARSREQASTRAEINFVEIGQLTKGRRTRINPLAFYTREMLESYALERGLPVNPLYWDGFLSVGCWPCTRAVRPGEDARAGRWAGKGKVECGLWVGDKAV